MILPTKIKLNQAKAAETKAQIDEGMALARKVDAMRELKLEQERNIKEWRDVTVKAVQDEINEIVSQRDTLKSEITVATERRNELRKPLDEEWEKVKAERIKLTSDQNKLFLDTERLTKESEDLEKEKLRINTAIKNAEENEKTTEEFNERAKSLKELVEKEYALARSDRDSQNKTLERKISEVNQSATEYEVALQTIEVREKQVEDKESELITREKDLARRINNLQRAEGLNK